MKKVQVILPPDCHEDPHFPSTERLERALTIMLQAGMRANHSRITNHNLQSNHDGHETESVPRHAKIHDT